MTDPHATDVLALLDDLLTAVAECAAKRARLEFHLRLSVAETPAPAAATLVRMPTPSGRPHKAKGELEALILAELTKCDALKTRELAALVDAHDESVRTCLQRLIKQAKVQRIEHGRYSVAPAVEVAQ